MGQRVPLEYAIVDLETTGGRPDRDKITEIAIVRHNGRSIIDTYSTLINPGVTIPPMISRLTGITQEMVDDAPPFYEVAKEIILRTEHCVFVAHNVRFDYHFLREAYRDLGFTYSRPFLCTVKMSRKAFPGLASYRSGQPDPAFSDFYPKPSSGIRRCPCHSPGVRTYPCPGGPGSIGNP